VWELTLKNREIVKKEAVCRAEIIHIYKIIGKGVGWGFRWRLLCLLRVLGSSLIPLLCLLRALGSALIRLQAGQGCSDVGQYRIDLLGSRVVFEKRRNSILLGGFLLTWIRSDLCLFTGLTGVVRLGSTPSPR
jgi:hypothetical protein